MPRTPSRRLRVARARFRPTRPRRTGLVAHSRPRALPLIDTLHGDRRVDDGGGTIGIWWQRTRADCSPTSSAGKACPVRTAARRAACLRATSRCSMSEQPSCRFALGSPSSLCGAFLSVPSSRDTVACGATAVASLRLHRPAARATRRRRSRRAQATAFSSSSPTAVAPPPRPPPQPRGASVRRRCRRTRRSRTRSLMTAWSGGARRRRNPCLHPTPRARAFDGVARARAPFPTHCWWPAGGASTLLTSASRLPPCVMCTRSLSLRSRR